MSATPQISATAILFVSKVPKNNLRCFEDNPHQNEICDYFESWIFCGWNAFLVWIMRCLLHASVFYTHVCVRVHVCACVCLCMRVCVTGGTIKIGKEKLASWSAPCLGLLSCSPASLSIINPSLKFSIFYGVNFTTKKLLQEST
jgi:hypothetical protein